jgi:hypothetical protein
MRFLLAAAILGAALLSAPDAVAGAVTFTVDAATLQSYLLAVTPYEVVVGKKGLSETLTLSNPREVRFAGGVVRLKMDVRGTPLAVEDVLDIALSVRWNEVKQAFEAKIESLPVQIPIFGTVNLAEYLRPFAIPSTFSEPVGEESPFGISGRITSLKVLDMAIQVAADITFHRVVKPAAPAASPALSGR